VQPVWARRALALLCALASAGALAAETLVVGSKRFTESYILGEIVARAAGEHAPVQYRPGLGNTGIVFAALEAGSIDVYPDYTGTLAREVLQLGGDAPLDEINRRLASRGIGVGVPLGFDNSYALAMREDRADALGIRTLSDLARHPDLRFGFSQEFVARADGWHALQHAYGLAGVLPKGLDHGLAYEALALGDVDVVDIYTTDAKIEPGVRVVDEFPDDTHLPIAYPVAVMRGARTGATRFAEFLAGDVARAKFSEFGFIALP